MRALVLVGLCDGILSFSHSILTYQNTDIETMVKRLCEALNLTIQKKTVDSINDSRANHLLCYRVNLISMVGSLRIVINEQGASILVNNGAGLDDQAKFKLMKPLCDKAGFNIMKQEYTECEDCNHNYPHDHCEDLNITMRTDFELKRKKG